MRLGGPGDADAGGVPDAELLAFLIADIRGYTSFTQQHGDEAAGRLTARFAEIVQEVVPQYSGTLFELRGDEAMCVFSSPRRCLRSALTLQQRFVEATIDVPELPMTVGIGVDIGEAVRSEHGYRGGALNMAARLCSRAAAGQVLASVEVTHLAGRLDGVRYVELDPVALKGMDKPVRPVRVAPDGEDPAAVLAALAATTVSPSRSRWNRRRRVAAIAIAGAAVLVAGLVTYLAWPSDTSVKIEEGSVGVVDPSSGRIVTDIEVGADADPTAAAAGFGSVWTANTQSNSVSRIDDATGQVTRIQVGSAPTAIATGLGAVWVTESGAGSVARINPGTGATQSIPVGTSPDGIAVAGNSVWVANTGDGTVSRIDPAKDRVVHVTDVETSPTGLAAGREIWVANSASGTISVINPASGAVTQTVPVGNGPEGITVAGRDVWVTNALDGTVDRVPVGGTAVTSIVPLGTGSLPGALTMAAGRLWVAARAGQTLDEVDPTATPSVVRRIPLGLVPGGLAAVGSRLDVTATFDPGQHRRGTITVSDSDPLSIDPSYTETVWAEWLLNGSYDGLVGYRRSGGALGEELVPDLAVALPTPTNGGVTNGGKTYTFRLRAGLRWSDGSDVTVQDVVRGLERAIVSGAVSIAPEIVGASGCSVHACHISGIVADPADATVTVTLVRPDGDFLSEIVPAPAVRADTPLAQQTKPLPATGPYKISTYHPGKLVVLTRNTYFRQWSSIAQPAGFPNRIVYRVAPGPAGVTGAVARDELTAVHDGKLDFMDARFAGPTASIAARFGTRLHLLLDLSTRGVVLNTRIAPFDNVRVRRALAYAIDRRLAASRWPGSATITCQVLPPDFPGYHPYCPYTLDQNSSGTWNSPDLHRAQALLRGIHTQGVPVTVWTSIQSAAGLRPVVAALKQLGFRARLKVGNPGGNYFAFVADSRNHVQAAFLGWLPESITPRNYFDPNFTCAGFQPADPNNANFAEWCDPTTEHLIQKAESSEATSPQAADQAWARVDRYLTDQAPWITLVNTAWADVVSARVHNYVRNPVVGVLFDQMWVE